MRTYTFMVATMIAATAAITAHAETLTAVHNGGTVGAAQHEAFFVPFAKNTGHTIVEDTFNQELAKLRSQEVAVAAHPPAVGRIADPGCIRIADGHDGHGRVLRTRR